MKKSSSRTARRPANGAKRAPVGQDRGAQRKERNIPAIIAIIILALIIIGGVSWYFLHQSRPIMYAALVNGEPITQEQLDFQYNLLPADYRAQFTQSQVLGQIIDEQLVVQAAQHEGIVATDKEVNERVQQILTQNNVAINDLQQNLAQLNITIDQFEQLIRRQLVIDHWRERHIVVPTPDDALLLDLYNKSLVQYTVGEQVTVRHVLVAAQRPLRSVHVPARLHGA